MPTPGTIQGRDAVLYFYTNDWEIYNCYTSVSISVNAELQSVKTVGDGPWAKYAYKGMSYAVALSGIVAFNDAAFTTWDVIENQLNFAELQFRLTFTDDNDNVKSIQGFILAQNISFTASINDFVKSDMSFVGNGSFMYYDGTIPCPVSITSVTINGQTSGDGNISVTYTYTGSLYQVKYRLDGTGPYSYALLAAPITFSNLAVGNHFIEMIPYCENGYASDSVLTDFQVTYAMTCSLAISSISQLQVGSTLQVTVNFNADPSTATLQYRLNSFPYIQYPGTLTNPTILNFNGLAPGPWTFQAIPYCSNGVAGTGIVETLEVTSGNLLSLITYNFTTFPSVGLINMKQIYKNGILVGTTSGTFTATPSDTILIRIQTTQYIPNYTATGTLQVTDSTISTTIFNQSYDVNNSSTNQTLQYQFSPTSGHAYSCSGVISP